MQAYRSICSLILLCTYFPASAQSLAPEVRVNPHAKRSTAVAPFDKEFVLVLPIDSSLIPESVHDLQIFKTKKDGEPFDSPSLDYNKDSLKKYANFTDSIQENKYRIYRVYINRQFPPNARIRILLIHGITQTLINKLDELNYLLLDGKKSQAETLYRSLAFEQFNLRKNARVRWQPFYLPDRDSIYNPLAAVSYYSFFWANLQSAYAAMVFVDQSTVATLRAVQVALTANHVTIQSVLDCNCGKQPAGTETIAGPVSDLTVPLYNLLHFSARDLAYIVSGQLTLTDVVQEEPLKISDIIKRQGNLAKSQAALKRIAGFLVGSSFSNTLGSAVKDTLQQNLENLYRNIGKSVNDLGENRSLVRKALLSNEDISAVDDAVSGAAPISQDLKTSSGNYIIPDVGLANIVSIIDHRRTYIIRPYFGVNINFRAIDKNQRLSEIKSKSLRKYLSLVVGLTTSPLSHEGISDLFSSMSLVTGIGVRVYRFVRITPAMLVYQAANGNPIKPNRYVVAPSLNLSLDLDVTTLFTALSGKLFK